MSTALVIPKCPVGDGQGPELLALALVCVVRDSDDVLDDILDKFPGRGGLFLAVGRDEAV